MFVRDAASFVGLACLCACGGAAAGSKRATPDSAKADSAGRAAADRDADWLPDESHVERLESVSSVAELAKRLESGLSGVTELDLSGRGWGPELGKVLSASKALSTLAVLDVGDNDMGPSGATELAH